MDTKLFDIRTTVTATFSEGAKTLAEVVIIAPAAIRERIWNIVVQESFNPGIARYKGGVPTQIILTPYPGYEGTDLVAQMALAAAGCALVEDFTDLFDKRYFTILGDEVVPWPKGFAVDGQILAEFQRRYVAHKAATTLKQMVDDLTNINYSIIYDWRNEAVEALRRLKFSDQKVPRPVLELIEAKVEVVCRYEALAKALYETALARKTLLRKKIADFQKEKPDDDPLAYATSYWMISAELEIEAKRLKGEPDQFDWGDLRATVIEIRKHTPPAPAKK